MAFGATTSVAAPVVPAQASRAFGRLTVSHSKRARLKRYARAMDWEFSPEGHLVGEVDGIALRVTEGPGRDAVIDMLAPAALPRMAVRPRSSALRVEDGLREMPTGDVVFDGRYRLCGAEPWLVRAVMDAGVRRVLLAAPTQAWTTEGEHLLSHSGSGFDPLDLLARATALRAVVAAVPWEAYSDRASTPSPAAVQAALRTRRLRPVEELPSTTRFA
ncbi:MAG: hypothetical protein U0S36_07785 [Candidatus Nanopelagicales bacterium]